MIKNIMKGCLNKMLKVSAEHICRTVLIASPIYQETPRELTSPNLLKSSKHVEFQQMFRNWLNRERRHAYVTETHLRIPEEGARGERMTSSNMSSRLSRKTK